MESVKCEKLEMVIAVRGAVNEVPYFIFIIDLLFLRKVATARTEYSSCLVPLKQTTRVRRKPQRLIIRF